MAKYTCTVCQWVYDEEKEGTKFEDLASDWVCPICGVEKDMFELQAQFLNLEKGGQNL